MQNAQRRNNSIFFINNVAKLAQFEDLLKKKERNEVSILTLLVHQSKEICHTINHSVPMVVRSDQTLATNLANQIKKNTLALAGVKIKERSLTNVWLKKMTQILLWFA